MKVKVFEGENLQLIIEQIKSEFGEGYTIIYQDIIEKRSFLPFFKKKSMFCWLKKRGRFTRRKSRANSGYKLHKKLCRF